MSDEPTTLGNASGARSFAGIRRLFASFIQSHKAQPWLRSADRRTAEKKTNLARRRGGGTTARARYEKASRHDLWHAHAQKFEQLDSSRLIFEDHDFLMQNPKMHCATLWSVALVWERDN
jgi:hypothetical protein